MTQASSRTDGQLNDATHDVGLRVMVILSALMSFASISTDIYLPALPTIARELKGERGGIELTLSAFLIGFSIGQLVWGPVSDRRGRRLPIAIGLSLFVAGSAGCALATNLTQMVTWRVVQALGASAGPVLARAMVRDLYGRERAAHMLSTLILIMGVAPLVGPLVGGQILLLASWQAIFWLLAALGLLTLASLRTLPETLTVAQRSTSPLHSVFTEYADLIRDRHLLRYALTGSFYYGGVYTFIIGTPFVYIDYFHVSPQAYGLLFGINIIGVMVANFVNTRMLHRLGSERILKLGTWISAVAGAIIALEVAMGIGGLLGIVIAMFFYVSMNGFVVANSVAGALSKFPQKAGAASSLVGAMHYGSGIFTASMLGHFTDGSPVPMGLIMAACGIGCVGTGLLLKP